MNRCVIACAFTAAAALAGWAQVDGAMAQTGAPKPAAATTSTAPSSERQIACTRGGCHPIPRGCRVEGYEFTMSYNTGYDKVVCPGR